MLDHLSVTSASLALAAGIFAVAVGLLFWLRFERSHRDGDDLMDADHTHFSSQDRRRNAGLAILLLVAQGIAISPQIDHRVGGRPKAIFLVVWWLTIFFLILVLLVLAFLDMLATRIYAKRHREQILRERTDLIRELEQLAHRDRMKEETSGSDSDPTPN